MHARSDLRLKPFVYLFRDSFDDCELLKHMWELLVLDRTKRR